jgi:predicted PurR-regulated permease PerM
MKNISTSTRFLVFLLVIAFVAVAILFAPFFSALVLTLVFGVMFAPVHFFLKKYIGSSTSAITTTALIAIVILGPVAFIVTQIAREASGIAVSLQSGISDTDTLLGGIEKSLSELVPWVTIDLSAYIDTVLGWLTGQTAVIFGGIASVGLMLFLSLFSVAYWFMDGARLKQVILETSPLEDIDTKNIFHALSASIHSVIKGKLLISGIQGIIAGLGYAIFGVPNAVLWATLTAICALVPNFGTAIAMVPIIGYLVLTGDMGSAVGLAVWGFFAVGLIDNILGPKLMSRGADVHPVFVILGVLGGIKLFGAVGLFAGPLIVSFFFAVFTAYTHAAKRHKNSNA